jgi:hypothetical protein
VVIHREYTLGAYHWVKSDLDPDTDTYKAILLADTYSPDLNAHEFIDDVIAHEIAAGGGYTAGGVTLTNVTINTVVAASLTAWAAATPYVFGDVVRANPSDGNIYFCTVAGTSGGGQPTWATGRYRETADNTVRWVNIGGAYVALDADNPAWPSSDISAAYCLIGKDGTAEVNDWLLTLVDFEGVRSSENGGNFEVLFHPLGFLVRFRG